MIKIGEKISCVKLTRLTHMGMINITTNDIFRDELKVVMFGFPGAFTPTCTKYHLPDAIRRSDQIRNKNVDEIIGVSVNDPFVLRHWEHVSGAKDKITLYSDWDGAFIKSMKLGMDGSSIGLGYSSQRFVMVVTNGIVQYLGVEDSPAVYCLTKSERLLEYL